MANNLTIQAVITAQDQASKVLKGFQNSLKSAEQGSKMFAGTLVAVGAAAAGFAIKAVQAYASAEASQKRFEQSLRQIAHASDEEIASLRKQQLALQQRTRFEDDAIASMQGFLATFQLSAKQIEEFTPHALDMVEGLRKLSGGTIELEQASNMLGKALQMGSVGMLAKAGVTIPGVTVAQKELFEETFKMATMEERLAMLTELVSGNFEGQAEAAGRTLAGAIDKLKNNFGGFMEIIGEALNKYIGPLVSKMAEWFGQFKDLNSIIKIINPTLATLRDNIYLISGAIMGALVPAMYALAKSTWTTFAPLVPFILIGMALGLMIQKLIEHFGGWGALTDYLKPKLEALWGTIQNATNVILPILATVWNTVLKPAFQEMWVIITAYLIPALKELWEKHGPAIKKALEIIAFIIGGVLLAVIVVIIGVIGTLIAIVTGVVKVFNWLTNVVKDVIYWTTFFAITISLGFAKAFSEVYQHIVNAIQWFRELPGRIGDALSGIGDTIAQPFRSAFQSIKDFWNSTIGGKGFSIPSWVPSVGGKDFKFPYMAEGGIVTKPTLAMIGEAGPEAVIPLSKAGGMGSNVTINFYGNVNNQAGYTPEEIGQIINRQLVLAKQGAF